MNRAHRSASVASGLTVAVALFASAACAPAQPAATAAQAQRTSVNAETFSIEVPGAWDQRPTEGGVELIQGEHDQIIVTVLDAPNANAEELTGGVTEALRTAIGKVCKRDGAVSPSERTAGAMPGVRFHLSCVEPRTLGTFVVTSSNSKVVTYEHYRYATKSMSPDLDAADQAILDTLHLKAAKAAPAQAAAPTTPGECPANLLAAANQNASTGMGGACFENAVLGDTTIKVCSKALEKQKWKRDKMTETLVSGKTGKKLTCYRRP